MQSHVDRAFEEWTYGHDPRQARIAIFEHIRDIPYSLELPVMDLNTAMERILLLKKGSCGPKHYLLAEMYRRLGLEVAFVTVPFFWNDPDIRYPQQLYLLAAKLPVAHHLACRARINNCRVLIDATWDPPLKRAGFPINENWDGQSEMLCAVKPCTEEQVRHTHEKAGMQKPGQLRHIQRFYREFDAWLMKIREQE